MDFEFAPSQQSLIDRAGGVARELIAPHTAHYDASGTYPRESWHDLWRQTGCVQPLPTA